tara:strand:- start:5507 stop:7123 length:1617 start_codon:yes stop_codon:yes gene_type:complete
MSVNDAAGLPVLEVNADNSVCAGRYGCSDFYISCAGNVGIGTTSPERKLHVYKGESSGAASNSDSALVLENNSSTYLQFLTPTTSESGLLFGDNDNDRGALTYSHNNDSMNFRVAANTRMFINSSGSVGIGTTSPSQKLHVVGTIKAGGNAQVFTANTPSSNSQACISICNNNGGSKLAELSVVDYSGVIVGGSLTLGVGITSYAALGGTDLNGGDLTLKNPSGTTTIFLDGSAGSIESRGLSGDACSVAIGQCALNSNTTGCHNVAVGFCALKSNTSGRHSVAVGMCALRNQTTGYGNVTSGCAAGAAVTTGTLNTYIGHQVAPQATVGSSNVFIGNAAGFYLGNGDQNTAIGRNALYNSYHCDNNTAIGYRANFTGNMLGHNIAVGACANSSTTVGHTVWGSSSNNVQNCVYTAWSNVSDCRDKTDISLLSSSYGISFIKKLKPVSYKWDNRDTYVRECSCSYGQKDGTLKSEKCHYGFIAQDIKSTLESLNITFDGLTHDSEKDAYRLTYEELIAPLVKAVQELTERVENLEAGN